MVRSKAFAFLLCAFLCSKFLKSVQSTELWDFRDGPWKPFFEAARDGDVRRAEDEIRKGVDVNIRGYNGMTPLHIAAQHGKDRVVTLLIDHGANVNDNEDDYSRTPLHLAVRNNQVDAVEVLLNNGASNQFKNSRGQTAMDIATEQGFEEIVKLLTPKPDKPWYCFFWC